METGALVKFRTDIRTEGMTCGSCAARVQTALGTTDGVIGTAAAMGASSLFVVTNSLRLHSFRSNSS